ncbi:mitochondrial ribonuclease P catalytic subunit isoform X2 [Choristoneura fumiferana]|uniref:mitochondrial ribonuclease P catalytic subunit isoform X2 n=1 Tax=Choristoneura fumiferana TaxID=7141 RepID=UPI003D1543D7
MSVTKLLRLNRRNEAVKVIQSSLNKKRPLQYIAYAEWINYILRKYKMNKTIVKHLDEICVHIARNSVTIDTATAEKLLEVYTAVGWSTQFSKIHKQSGQCNSCKETLQCLKLSMEEFHKLQNNIKEKLIVGSDLFLKTSPDELQRFQKFIEKTAPYDIVLDSLNIALAVGTPNSVQRISFLKAVVDQFKRENKRILLLGRNHMLKWPRQPLDYLRRNTFSFFTDNLSQDDPYFITAAILSGPHTDIVSKDLLRGHMFLLQDEELRHIFKRWQWQHQWMVFANKGRPQILPPLKFTPFAQKLNDGWHLPYEKEAQSTGQVNIGVPDLTNWLCLRPKQNK